MSPLPLMPQELWNNVSSRLSTLGAVSAADIFGFGIDSSQRKHAAVWRKIFKDDIWALRAVKAGLNPFLLGSNLLQLYHKGTFQKPLFLVLRVCDDSGDCQYDADTLFTSLQPHTYDIKTKEVTFPEGIIINVHDIVSAPKEIKVDIRRVLHQGWPRHLRTSYIHWEDKKYRIRQLTRKSMRGELLKKAANFDSISKYCFLDIKNPNGGKHGLCGFFRGQD